MDPKQETMAFYQSKGDLVGGCLLALRDLILSADAEITTEWKYKMPFFCYKGSMFCYLWVDKKTLFPYLGIVEGQHVHHPELLAEKRSRMKIIRFNPEEDLPAGTITVILQQALDLYRTGIIKTQK